MPRSSRILDHLSTSALALFAGGGSAFFLFARTLFDQAPKFSQHPRYDAGEVVGPIVQIAGYVGLAAGVIVFLAATCRWFDPTVAERRNRALTLVGLLLIALAAVQIFWLTAEIQAVRAAVGQTGFDGDAASPDRARFGMLHGIANVLMLIGVAASWIGLWLERSLASK